MGCPDTRTFSMTFRYSWKSGVLESCEHACEQQPQSSYTMGEGPQTHTRVRTTLSGQLN